MFAEVETDMDGDLVVGKSLVETLEASEAYQKAAAILEPILAAIAEKDAQKQAKRTAVLKKNQELRQLKEDLERKAAEAIATDPAIIAAQNEILEAERAAE